MAPDSSRSRPLSAQSLPAYLAASFLAERDRWVLWVPVLIGAGIGAYFGLTVEPPLWTGGVLFGIAGLAWLRLRLVSVGIGLFALGFVAAQGQAMLARAPVLGGRVGPVAVEGRLVEIDPFPQSRRLLVEPQAIDGIDAAALPKRIRVRADRGGDALAPGDRLRFRAMLYPPPAPAMPGAYDFQRRAFFDRLGGVGFAVGRVALAEAAPSPWLNRLEGLRAAMTDRIRAVLPGTTGGAASAIITGETHTVPEKDADAFRDAGLAHILVIAGLHMGMLAGLVFGGVRAGLALIPPLALRHPIKKWAAGAALLMCLCYLLLSGVTVSSRRAFVMTGLVFLAVMIDRNPFSLRSLALAAILILLWTPFALTGPAFQMSFAAVGALLAFYEAFRPRFSAALREAGPAGHVALHGFGIAVTTIVCTVATAPYTVYHFDRFAVYSVVANIVAVPITGLWVMPWGIVSCLLMPLHLEAWGLVPMGWGIDAIIWIARRVTSWPGAVVTLPAMPFSGLLLVTAGALWLAIWRRCWRYWGVVPILLGLASIAFVRPPDLLVAGEGRLLALRAADGSYMLSRKPRKTIDAEVWLRRAAAEPGEIWPREGVSADGRLTCNRAVCFYTARGRKVALLRTEADDTVCAADLVVSPLFPMTGCRGRTALIDAGDLARKGTHAVWLEAPAIRIEAVEDGRGDRPWVLKGSGGGETASQ